MVFQSITYQGDTEGVTEVSLEMYLYGPTVRKKRFRKVE